VKAWIFAIASAVISASIVEFTDFTLSNWEFWAILLVALAGYKFGARMVGL